jgi:hypothetical protein
MTNYGCESLFLTAMDEKRIVCYENRGSKDHYHIHAYRRTGDSVRFFCLVESFFRSQDDSRWLEGSIRAFHEFSEVLGATVASLVLTDESFEVETDYRLQLPILSEADEKWITVD